MARYAIVKSWSPEHQEYFWEAFRVDGLYGLFGYTSLNWVSGCTSVISAEICKNKLMKYLNKDSCTLPYKPLVEMYVDA